MRRCKACWLIRSAWLPVVTAPLAMHHQLDARFLCVSNEGYPTFSVSPLCGFFRDCVCMCLRTWVCMHTHGCLRVRHTLFAHLPLCSCVWECSHACMCACLCVCLLACACVRACVCVRVRASLYMCHPYVIIAGLSLHPTSHARKYPLTNQPLPAR